MRQMPNTNDASSSPSRSSPARSFSIVISITCCIRSAAACSSRRCFSPYSRTRGASRRYSSASASRRAAGPRLRDPARERGLVLEPLDRAVLHPAEDITAPPCNGEV